MIMDEYVWTNEYGRENNKEILINYILARRKLERENNYNKKCICN